MGDLSSQYAGGKFFINASSIDNIKRALVNIAPYDSSINYEGAKAEVIDILHKTNAKFVFIFDNADNAATLKFIHTEFDSRVLGKLGYCIITTRISPTSIDNENVIELETINLHNLGTPLLQELLDEQSSISTIYRYRESCYNPVIPVDVQDKQLLSAKILAWYYFQGLPLAIRQAGVYMREQRMTFSEYVVLWESNSAYFIAEAEDKELCHNVMVCVFMCVLYSICIYVYNENAFLIIYPLFIFIRTNLTIS
jgi:hypothetical protein